MPDKTHRHILDDLRKSNLENIEKMGDAGFKKTYWCKHASINNPIMNNWIYCPRCGAMKPKAEKIQWDKE